MKAVDELHAADRVTRFGIVGAGLVGGSIAKAVAAADACATIALYDISEPNRSALSRSVAAAHSVARLADLADCQCVFVCTPVSTIASLVRSIAAVVGADATIIDCGSAKRAVLEDVDAGGGPIANYVPGHPMGGGTSSGPDLSSAEIIAGHPFVLCPVAQTRVEAVAQAEEVIRRLGGRPVRMRAEDHDRAIATSSHLPHLLAFALVGLLAQGETADSALLGGSFRGISRYAASDPAMWTDIFRANRRETIGALQRLEGEVAALRALIDLDAPEPLRARLESLSKRRRALED